MNSAVKYGVALGVISIAIQIIMYAIGDATNAWIPSVIGIGAFIYFCVLIRKDVGGYITFGEAFKAFLVMGLIGAVIQTVYTYVFYNFIDPDLAITIKEQTIEMTESTLENFNVPQEDIDTQIDELREKDFFSVSQILQGFALANLPIALIGSAILAAIFKKSDPKNLDY